MFRVVFKLYACLYLCRKKIRAKFVCIINVVIKKKSINAEFARNATQIIDRYHFIRQILWAPDNVRKRVQMLYGDRNRKLFKHSKRLLIKRSSKLKDYEKERINAI